MLSRSERNLEKSGLLNINLHIFVEITGFLDVKSVFRLSMAAKGLHKRISNGEFWRLYYVSQKMKLFNLKPPELKALDFYTKLHKFFQTVPPQRLPMIGLEASTTDFDQSINNVLSEDRHRFWSSLGSDTTAEKEYLLFDFPELSVVKSVQIDFFNAGGIGHDQEYYLSNEIVVMLGTNEEDWFYQSKPFLVNNQPSCVIPLQQEGWGVARCMKLVFHGKLGLQDSDNKYYIAIESARTFGYSLNLQSPMFQLESALILESMCNYYNIPLTEEELIKNHDPKYYLAKLKTRKLLVEDDVSVIIQKYRELLQANADATAKWRLLQKHKSVLSTLDIFEFIRENDKDFAKDYFKILQREHKRDVLTLPETYLAVMTSINSEGLQSKVMNRDAAFKLINFQIFQTFRFYTINKALLEKVCDKVRPEQPLAKKFLLEKIPLPEDEPLNIQSTELIGILLAMVIVISN